MAGDEGAPPAPDRRGIEIVGRARDEPQDRGVDPAAGGVGGVHTPVKGGEDDWTSPAYDVHQKELGLGYFSTGVPVNWAPAPAASSPSPSPSPPSSPEHDQRVAGVRVRAPDDLVGGDERGRAKIQRIDPGQPHPQPAVSFMFPGQQFQQLDPLVHFGQEQPVALGYGVGPQLGYLGGMMGQQPQMGSICSGITLDNFSSTQLTDYEDCVRGFHHLVGDAVRWQATVRSNTGRWPPSDIPPGCIGRLWNHRLKQPTWDCIELDSGRTGFRRWNECRSFVRGAQVPTCCGACEAKKHLLLKQCREEVAARDDPANGTTQFEYMRTSSPVLWEGRAREQSKTIHTLRTQKRRQDAAIERLRAAAESIPNVNAEALFDNEAEWKRSFEEAIKSETDTKRKEIFKLLFLEMEVVRDRKLKFGDRHGHEWSTLMIQFCVYIRFGNGASGGMSKSAWDFMAKVFNLPPNRTLMRYAHTDTSSPDGLCLQTILQQAALLDEAASDLDHPMRYGKIGVDSMTIKEKFAHDPNTNAIIGVAYDAFHPDVIVEEFQRLQKDAERADASTVGAGDVPTTPANDGEADNGDDEKGLAKGRHYMVFTFQSWSGARGHEHIHFVAARYAIAAQNARWLRKAARSVLAMLATFHMKVVGVAFDGASENRTYMHWTCVYMLKELLGDLLQSPTDPPNANSDGVATGSSDGGQAAPRDESDSNSLGDNVSAAEDGAKDHNPPENDAAKPALDPTPRKFAETKLPWEMKVAFEHPCIDGLIVLALADMCHGIKKETNAVEKGNLRSKEHYPINMDMLKAVYMACPDMTDKSPGRLMEFIRLTLEIFEKNSKNRMRVPHAVKLHSGSMHRCIEKYAPLIENQIPLSHWEPAKEYIRKTNRWVDVMNNSSNNGCKFIDSVYHPHIYELLDYVSFLFEWKNAVHPDDFFPESTFEDVVWTCTGVVLTATIYLPIWEKAGYPGVCIVQRRHGTDDLELLFCKARGGNANADAKGMNNMISGVSCNVFNEMGASRNANNKGRDAFAPTEWNRTKVPKVDVHQNTR